MLEYFSKMQNRIWSFLWNAFSLKTNQTKYHQQSDMLFMGRRVLFLLFKKQNILIPIY